jgi:hypothetical protein
MKLEDLSDDELFAILEFLPGKTLHRLIVMPIFSQVTRFYYSTFTKLSSQRKLAIEAVLEKNKNTKMPHKKTLIKLVAHIDSILKQNVQPKENIFWANALKDSNSNMMTYKRGVYQEKYGLNQIINIEKWKKYVLQLRHFHVYNIDKVFNWCRKIRGVGSTAVTNGMAFCMDCNYLSHSHFNESNKQNYHDVLEILLFFIQNTEFEIWHETDSKPYEMFLTMCLFLEEYELLKTEMSKFHKLGKKFEDSPMNFVLKRKREKFPKLKFIQEFYNSEVELYYNVKEKTYLKNAMRNCPNEICDLIEILKCDVSEISWKPLFSSHPVEEIENVTKRVKEKFEIEIKEI